MSFDDEGLAAGASGRKWWSAVDCNRLHTRSPFELQHKLVKERVEAFVVFVLAEAERHIGREDVVGIVTCIDLLQFDEAAQHEACADQQHEADCYLPGDQEIAHPIAAALQSRGGAALL